MTIDKNGKLGHMKYMNNYIYIIYLRKLFLNSETFRTAPRSYEQVLNIMGANLLNNTYLKFGHILLKGKKEIDY